MGHKKTSIQWSSQEANTFRKVLNKPHKSYAEIRNDFYSSTSNFEHARTLNSMASMANKLVSTNEDGTLRKNISETEKKNRNLLWRAVKRKYDRKIRQKKGAAAPKKAMPRVQHATAKSVKAVAMLKHPFYLRRDLVIYLELPANLTKREAERLALAITSFPTD